MTSVPLTKVLEENTASEFVNQNIIIKVDHLDKTGLELLAPKIEAACKFHDVICLEFFT